jgi:hypothetical protein
MLLVMAALLVAQVLAFWLFVADRGQAVRMAQALELADRAVALSDVIAVATLENRAVLGLAASAGTVHFVVGPPLVVADDAVADDALYDLVRARLDAGDATTARLEIRPITPHEYSDDSAAPTIPFPLRWLRGRMTEAGVAPSELRISLDLSDGDWLNVSGHLQRPDVGGAPIPLLTIVVSFIILTVALWLGLRRVVGPLRTLADTADGFGLDTTPSQLAPRGPREVKALAQALNRMQQRLAQTSAFRTRMLAALGHDLRTPLTALRFRTEMVDDDENRERMTETLAEMQEMIEDTLSYARGISSEAPTEPVDLAKLLESLRDERPNDPITLHCEPPETMMADLRLTPVRRALRNLIDNALRYGDRADISLICDGAIAYIEIADSGDGLPEDQLEQVFEPFVRQETSRSRDTGGTGLGLSIARDILRAHGGDVTLVNRSGGGLTAMVRLPLAAL